MIILIGFILICSAIYLSYKLILYNYNKYKVFILGYYCLSIDEEKKLMKCIKNDIISSLLFFNSSLFEKYIRGVFFKVIIKSGTHTLIGPKVRINYTNGVKIGNMVHIRGYSYISAWSASQYGIIIGDRSKIGEYVRLDSAGGKIILGENVAIGPNCYIYAYGIIDIGNNCLIADNTKIFASNHIYKNPDQLIGAQGVDHKGVKLEDDVWIGSSCVILDGVKIGKGAIVGAGSVVTKDVEPFTLVAGSPARFIKSRG